VASYEEKKDS